MPQQNRYAEARAEAEPHPDFLDLIDTNFHSCGFLYPGATGAKNAVRYFEDGSLLRRYRPDAQGDRSLRETIAAFYRGAVSGAASAGDPPTSSPVPVDPDHVVVTASASECYAHIFAGLCIPGDAIALPRPGYPIFEDLAARAGLVALHYDQNFNEKWAIDPDRLEASLTDEAKLLLVISPNNPTGSVVDEETATRLLEICERHGLVMVVDEVFSDFVYEGDTLVRPASLGSDAVVITMNGASKLLASPDLKVSWMCVTGAPPERNRVVELLATENDQFLSSSPLNQLLVKSMLDEYPLFTKKMVGEVEQRRNRYLGQLAEISDVRAVPAAGGIHLPLLLDRSRLPRWLDDEALAVSLLSEARVATHPGYLYGFVQDRVLVTSFLAPPDRLEEGVRRISELLATISG